ncbi:MAG: [Fe-S]-binding protein [Candidatus Altiarchaeales archaeon]|nr:MAG: [Fe-S]-binding protein [Candidatus Altiarchaeales archaeon]
MNKYLLKFPSDVVDSPIIASTVLETGILVNILRAKVDYDEGTIVISILGNEREQRKVVDALIKKGIEVSKLEKNIANDVSRCINCGACIALCPTNAISFTEDWSIKVEGDKCIRCGACVEACPLRSLSIQEI